MYSKYIVNCQMFHESTSSKFGAPPILWVPNVPNPGISQETEVNMMKMEIVPT